MQTDPLKDDLAYVAETLRKHQERRSAPLIYVFWAVAIFCGFALVDFQPTATGLYWLVVAPIGAIVSTWLAIREAKRSGVRDRSRGHLWGQHFLVGGAGWVAAALPMVSGRVHPAQGGTTFLLVTGLVYALAGVHLDRGLLISGVIALVGYALMQFIQVPYMWTAVGGIMAVALVIAAIASGAQRSEA